MTYLDTNTLLALSTNYHKDQNEKILELVDSSPRRSLRVLDSVMSEFCFVLQFSSQFLLSREAIHRILTDLLRLPQISVSATTERAIKIYSENKTMDYVDCQLVALAEKGETIFTFDKRVQKMIT